MNPIQTLDSTSRLLLGEWFNLIYTIDILISLKNHENSSEESEVCEFDSLNMPKDTLNILLVTTSDHQ
jgi:hypothetical protein